MRRRVGMGAFVAAGLAVVVALVVLVSPFASTQPDGLARVAEDQGFAEAARPHALEGAPAADYEVDAAGGGRLSTGVAGLLGVVVTFAASGALFLVVRRKGAHPGSTVDRVVPAGPRR